MVVSVYWLLSVFVCVISTVFELDCMCQSSVNLMLYCKNTLQGPSGTKEPRLDMYRSILSLSKIAYQMQCDHPFS